VFHLAVFDDGLMFRFATPTRNKRTELQAKRSRVRFPMISLEFFIYIILWPWGRLSL